MQMFTESIKAIYLNAQLRMGIWSGSTPPAYLSDAMNFTKLEITPSELDQFTVISTKRDTLGRTDAVFSKPKGPAKFSAEYDEFHEELLQILMGSTKTTESVTGATITDQPVTTVLNSWVSLGKRHIDTVGFELNTLVPALVDASKYIVDYNGGFIKAIHADAVGSMTVTFDYKTSSNIIYNAGVGRETSIWIEGEVTDQMTGETGFILIPRVNVINSESFPIVSDKNLMGKLAGFLNPPDGYDGWTLTNYTVS